MWVCVPVPLRTPRGGGASLSTTAGRATLFLVSSGRRCSQQSPQLPYSLVSPQADVNLVVIRQSSCIAHSIALEYGAARDVVVTLGGRLAGSEAAAGPFAPRWSPIMADDNMDVDDKADAAAPGNAADGDDDDGARVQVKKWNAVALWRWGRVCARAPPLGPRHRSLTRCRHRVRHVRHLQEPDHGAVHRVPGRPAVGVERRLHGRLGRYGRRVGTAPLVG